MKISEYKIYPSREKAWLSFQGIKISRDKLYLRHYYIDKDKSDIDFILVYSLKDCDEYSGNLDYLRLISGDKPIPFDHSSNILPDISELSKGERILWIDTSGEETNVYMVWMNRNTGQIECYPFGDVQRKVYLMREGRFGFATSHKFKTEDDYYSSGETSDVVKNKLTEEVFPEINKLKIKLGL